MKEVTPKTVTKLYWMGFQNYTWQLKPVFQKHLVKIKQVIVNHLTEIMEPSNGVEHSSPGLPIQHPIFKAIAQLKMPWL